MFFPKLVDIDQKPSPRKNELRKKPNEGRVREMTDPTKTKTKRNREESGKNRAQQKSDNFHQFDLV